MTLWHETDQVAWQPLTSLGKESDSTPLGLPHTQSLISAIPLLPDDGQLSELILPQAESSPVSTVLQSSAQPEDAPLDPLTGNTDDEPLCGSQERDKLVNHQASESDSIVFIDSRVPDYQSLIAGVNASEVIVLNPNQDGVKQITEVLAEHSQIASVHIVSHGDDASLALGNTELSSETLSSYGRDLQAWAKALTPNADILLYGCNVAASEAGAKFIQQVSELTGADLNASNDLTGNIALGGDWQLEAATGKIDSTLAFQPGSLEHYQATLATTNISFSDFSSVSGLKLNGSAAQAGTALRLTPDSQNTTGTALSNNLLTINTTTTFQTQFQFRLGGSQGTSGADGFTFVLQNSPAGTSFLGGRGGNLGYGGVSSSSLAIEFDTHQNAWDANTNNISILTNGNTQTPLATIAAPIDLNSGSLINAWVDYNTDTANPNQLEIFLSSSTAKPTSAVLSRTIDLATTLGPTAYAGFSAGTGGKFNSQDIQSWQLTASTDTGSADVTAPTASLSAPALTTAGGSFYDFTVTYSDTSGVKVATLDSNDLQVTTPGGSSLPASFRSVVTNSNGSVTATYRITPADGTWSLDDNGAYTIRLNANQVSDSLGNSATSATSLGTFQVAIPNPGTIGLDKSLYTVNESAGFATITILRTGGSAGVASVDYTTGNSSAIAGSDYSATTGTLTFADGQTSNQIKIPILNDTLSEDDETFLFSMDRTVGATLGAPRTANITIVDNDRSNTNTINFNYPNFADVSNLQLNGDATGAANSLRLTTDAAKKQGSSFYKNAIPVDANTSFQTQFQFSLTGTQGTSGSDGFTFILQSSATGASYLGGIGGDLGYGGGGSNSLAIEFDTSKNTWDANNNNISILSNGNVETPLATVISPFDLNSGTPLNAWVDYNGTSNLLSIFISNSTTKPGTAVLIKTLDLATILGSQAFAGFGAGTGGRYNAHQIDNWQFTSSGTAPVIEFSQAGATVDENAGTVNVTVSRTAGLAQSAASINYTTKNGTAIAGVDYTAVSGTLNFAAGETTKTIAVPIRDNTAIELNRDFTLTLSNPVGGNLGTKSSTLVTIGDNDIGSFAQEQVIGGLVKPTAIDWTPDGNMMFIAQKDGTVRVFEDGALRSTPFINISSQVNNAKDRGLLGLAVHPDFADNPYVYLLFTYDPPEVYDNASNPDPDNLAGPDETGNRPSRLIRVTADASNGYRTAVAGSAVVLLGTNSIWEYTSSPDTDGTNNLDSPPSGIDNGTTVDAPSALIDGNNNIRDYLATDSTTHSIGSVKFAPDGSLFVSNGDGASFGRVDPRGTRVQDLDNLSGKILRIDPITGKGLSTNPFYNGNAASNRSKVYNYGLRNPFRFTIQRDSSKPNYNQPYVGDVGWRTWEEINTGRGKNFGWPYYEGASGGVNEKTSGYSTLPSAEEFYASNPTVTPAIYAKSHLDGATAVIMGDFYTGSTFPGFYDGALFFNDVYNGSVSALVFNSDGSVKGVKSFDTDAPTIVQMKTGPDGSLYYVNLGGSGATGQIGRWRATS
jgi:glucose/arabinose dehydrogenase